MAQADHNSPKTLQEKLLLVRNNKIQDRSKPRVMALVVTQLKELGDDTVGAFENHLIDCLESKTSERPKDENVERLNTIELFTLFVTRFNIEPLDYYNTWIRDHLFHNLAISSIDFAKLSKRVENVDQIMEQFSTLDPLLKQEFQSHVDNVLKSFTFRTKLKAMGVAAYEYFEQYKVHLRQESSKYNGNGK